MSEDITLDTIISGIVCNVCGEDVPPHTAREHLEIANPIHQCPHPTAQQSPPEQ